jgi:hypothetical protein
MPGACRAFCCCGRRAFWRRSRLSSMRGHGIECEAPALRACNRLVSVL